MAKAREWVEVVDQKLGGLTPGERDLATAAAKSILDEWSPRIREMCAEHEVDAMGGMVAMVELARALGRGDVRRGGGALA
jgi:hypothetical protein